MNKIYKNVLDLIGNTPLIEIENLQKKINNINSKILLKLEMFNPAGSIKDRAAREMILNALEKGIINKDTIIIEPTSGNTGIGLASICNYLGLKVIIIMPENMSLERIKLLKAYNAEVILTDASQGMSGAIEKANSLHLQYVNSFIPFQFSNENNSLAHYKTTAEEIIKDTEGKIDYVIAGIGTGGTITGISKKLKEYNPNIKIIGVEPYDSPLLTQGKFGSHKLQGIGANFVPDILDLSLVDDIYDITTEEAYDACKLVTKYEGILVGITSGACVAAALKLSEKKENKGKVIVCIAPDSGERYLSTDLYSE